MAEFYRGNYRWDENGNRRTEAEIDEIEKEFYLQQKQKQNKMVKTIIGGIIAFLSLIILFKSCERIDAGHVGVKVNLYGDNKGVSDVTEVTGMVFFNPITHNIHL
jgi:hypothetical protein